MLLWNTKKIIWKAILQFLLIISGVLSSRVCRVVACSRRRWVDVFFPRKSCDLEAVISVAWGPAGEDAASCRIPADVSVFLRASWSFDFSLIISLALTKQAILPLALAAPTAGSGCVFIFRDAGPDPRWGRCLFLGASSRASAQHPGRVDLEITGRGRPSRRGRTRCADSRGGSDSLSFSRNLEDTATAVCSVVSASASGRPSVLRLLQLLVIQLVASCCQGFDGFPTLQEYLL